ncbi:MAG: glycosyltransferase family protein [Planctomycetota bacterium]|jgi:hypothetical protein
MTVPGPILPTSTPAASPAAPAAGSPADLRSRLAAGRVHEVIHELWRASDPPVASGDAGEDGGPAARLIWLVQALASLRLGAAARRVLAARATAELDVPAIDAQLATLPDGRLDWDRFDRTLQENLVALAEHHPEVAARLGDADAVRERLRRLEPHRDAAGLVHVLRPADDASAGTWLGGFVDRRPERGFTAPVQGGTPERLLIAGVGTGRLVDRGMATTETASGAPPVQVHLLEPDLDAFAAWLALADRRAALVESRLIIAVGSDATDLWVRRMTDRTGLAVPDRVFCADPDTDLSPLADARATIVRRRTESIHEAVHDLARRWAAIGDADAAARIRPGATVIGFTSRYTTVLKHAMRDVARCFETLGYRFVLVEEPSEGEHLFAADIARRIAEEDAALVVVFNRLRPDSIPLFGPVPLLSIVLDPVDEILSRQGATRVGPRDVLAGFYADRAVREFGYPARRYLPQHFFPIDPTRFHDGPLDAADADRFACDLVYVGHCKGTPEAWHAQCLRSFQPSIDPVLEAAREILNETTADGRAFIDHGRARQIADEACRRAGVDLPDRVRSNVAAMHVHRLHDITWRRTALQWAARWAARTGRRLHLHGEGWSRDPEFRPFDRGPVSNETEARKAYRGARLALQLLPSGFAHQRSFEALASGTLVITRESPNDFLLGDRHAFRRQYGDGDGAPSIHYRVGFRGLDETAFADEAEFAACCERWLGDDDARTARRDQLAAVVRSRCTWDAVLPRVLDGVRAAIALT